MASGTGTSVRTDDERIKISTRDEALELEALATGRWQVGMRGFDGWTLMTVDRTDLLMLHEWIFKQLYQPKNVIED